MNRGEVWWYELPDSSRRPECILTRQAAIPVLKAVLVTPVTQTIRHIPTHVRLGPEDGMPTECALTFDNLVTVPKALLTERMTRLRSARLAELCRPSTSRPAAHEPARAMMLA
jgi:mRNA interferase MazF